MFSFARRLAPGRQRPCPHGFTLIELLVVVAILAILSAIAVPNFMEAQVRSKAARAKSDIRTLATGIHAYSTDYQGFPDVFTRLNTVTTPVQYLTTIPQDPFRKSSGSRMWRRGYYRYGAMPIAREFGQIPWLPRR